jgi:hypothetical protein
VDLAVPAGVLSVPVEESVDVDGTAVCFVRVDNQNVTAETKRWDCPKLPPNLRLRSLMKAYYTKEEPRAVESDDMLSASSKLSRAEQELSRLKKELSAARRPTGRGRGALRASSVPAAFDEDDDEEDDEDAWGVPGAELPAPARLGPSLGRLWPGVAGAEGPVMPPPPPGLSHGAPVGPTAGMVPKFNIGMPRVGFDPLNEEVKFPLLKGRGQASSSGVGLSALGGGPPVVANRPWASGNSPGLEELDQQGLTAKLMLKVLGQVGDDAGDGLGSVGKSLRRLHRMQGLVKSKSERVIREYLDELMARMGIEPGEPWQIWHVKLPSNL